MYTALSEELASYLYSANFYGLDNTHDMPFIKETMGKYWFFWELGRGILNWSDYVLLISLSVLVLFTLWFIARDPFAVL